MGRKITLWNYLRVDLYRSIVSWRFLAGILGISFTMDEQVSLFLKLLFHKDSTRQFMEKVFADNGNFQGEDAGRKRP